MRRSDLIPPTPHNLPQTTPYDPQTTRPKPSQCSHQRGTHTAWATVGLTHICGICLLERCTVCHRSITGTDYAAHDASNCPNR